MLREMHVTLQMLPLKANVCYAAPGLLQYKGRE